MGQQEDVLKQMKVCMEQLGKPQIKEALQNVFRSLMEYFAADMVLLSYSRESEIRYVEECHTADAGKLAETLAAEIESGKAKESIERIKQCGFTVTSQKDRFGSGKELSVIAAPLYQEETLLGVLAVIQPRQHLSEAELVSLLSVPLALRISLKNEKERQEYERTHDSLTGLWNREGLSTMVRTGGEQKFDTLGIITTDVIHLSEINKQFGYISGNRRLMEVADLLKELFPEYRIYRFDEDEMLILCVNITREQMEQDVEKLQEALKHLGFGVAMGYSWCSQPNTKNQITEAEVIMTNDKLSLMHKTTVMKRMEQSVIDEINDLMERGRYLVYLQPKVDIHTGRTEGAEALIRQLDDELGIVGPGMFIPVLEHYNLVHMIDLFVLEEVFKYQQEQIKIGHRTVPISVNFSKMTIMYPDLLQRVTKMVKKYDIPIHLIHIEVTETVGDMDHVVIEDVANSLKDLGFCLSMDDFGSHYSNLAVLIQYDFDSAKIDRSMVTEITNNRKSRILLDYMTSMINDLGIHCIVEGIETKEQVEILKETKAEMIQGFYFGKPIPKEKFYDTFIAEEAHVY